MSIGLQIMLASAALVLGIVAVAVVFILHQALPREQIDRDRSGLAHVYVDTGDVFQALVVIGLGAVVFAGLVSWIIARRSVRPLGDALRRQREFVADASHELRTPLAVLDARIQVIERRVKSADPPSRSETEAMVTELRADSRGMVDIVNDLLLAAGGEESREEPVTVGPVVVAAVDSLRILATDKGVKLSVDVDDVARVRISVASLRRCVIALVDNAIAHSPGGSIVSVSSSRIGRSLRLLVADQGSGIQGVAPERIFDRFARSATTDTARPSFGIGLALVQEIVHSQGGRVSVVQTSPVGTTIAVDLPRAG